MRRLAEIIHLGSHVKCISLLIAESDIHEEECQEQVLELIKYMNHMLKQKVFTRVEQVEFVKQMEQLCETLFQNAKHKMVPACYECIMGRTMELKEYDKAEIWGSRFCKQYPEQLSSYTLRLKLYFETNQKDKFFEVLDQLRASSVVVDNKTQELIRMIQR